MRQAGAVVLGAGAGLASGLGAAVAVFAKFDDQMRAVRAVTQASESDFMMLTNTAKELGRTTSFTAGQVAGLMTELGRAGFDPTQINAMTGAVLDLSKATGTDASLSSGILAATIRQFSLEAGDASRVADALTIAANKSFNTVEQLGEAMQYAGPVAADLGLSMEETLAILGGLGNVGIQASAAGTVLRRLATLSAANAEKMEEAFGVAFLDASGNARPLVQVLGEVNEATKGLGDGERTAKFKKAFGLIGITAANVIGKSAGSIVELQAAIENSAGAANKAATEMEAGIGGSFRKLLSAVEGIAIAIGNALNGPVSAIADMLTNVSGYITKFVKENEYLVRIVGYVAVGLVAGGAALLALATALSVASFAVGAIVSVMGILSSIAGVVATAIGAVGAILGAILSPVGLVVVAIAGTIAAFLTMTEAGRAVVTWFSDNFGKLFAIVGSTVTGMADALRTGDLSLAAEIAFTGVKLAIATVMSEIEKAFGVSFEKMFQVLAQFTKAVAVALARLNVARVSAINFLSEAIAGVFTSEEVQQTLREDNQRRIDAAKNTVDSANDFDADKFGTDVAEGFDVDKLQAKLDELKNRARTQVELQAAGPIDDAVKKIEEAEVKIPDFDLGNTIGRGQKETKISSQGTFSGLAAARLGGGGSVMNRLLTVTEKRAEFARKEAAKQARREAAQLEAIKANKPKMREVV